MTYSDRYAQWRSLPQVFFDKAAELGEKPFAWSKHQKSWRPLGWRAAQDEVSGLSRGLRRLGVAPGDRVALVSENRPEWALAELAIMAARAITVPAYTTNTVADHTHVLKDFRRQARDRFDRAPGRAPAAGGAGSGSRGRHCPANADGASGRAGTRVE